MSVRVQLLGPVRAFADGDRVALRGRTARTVLARLALEPGRVVSVDQLTEALWDDDPPEEPVRSIRSIVSRLRAQLGRDAIVTDGAGYRLEPTIVEVDVDEIERATKDPHLVSTGPDELAAMLRRWDGDPFADVAWTSAFEPQRARLGELRARLTDAYFAAMLRHDRADEALADLERDAAAAPLRESTQMLLMRALARVGRTADALRVGNDYRGRLVERSGLDPSARYEELARSLLEPAAPTPVDRESPSGSNGPRPPDVRAWAPPDTPFVGRRTEFADLRHLLREHRLVTVTGPGGVGKTRLVTELMNDVDARPTGNIHMVELATLERTAPVDTAVAARLGLEVTAGAALRALVDRLSSIEAVLVLDNCEHVLPGTRELVEHLLRNVAPLRVVVTSRIRLGFADEAILDVGPLAVPFEGSVDSAPVRLFVDRVTRTAPSIRIDESEITVAADICRLVDGLPLALELAAARVPMFGFEGLRRHLLDGLALPSAATGDDRRQATIESTVEWSFTLLSPDARRLFDELSVFPSWFTLDALAQVSSGERTVDALSEILDSSLVVIDHGGPAYRLLEPVRQVVRRQLDDASMRDITRRYLAWVDAIVADVDARWTHDDRRGAQHLIIDRRDDLRAALHHVIDRGDAEAHGRIANLLSRALVDRSDSELIDLCRAEPGPSLEGDLARCMLAWHQGDAHTSLRFSEAIERQVAPDSPHWGDSHWIRAPLHLYTGDVDLLAHHASVAACDELCSGSVRSESVAMWALGLLYSGRRSDAEALLEEYRHILELSDCAGFVQYTRAEVAAETAPELALTFLAEASESARHAEATFTQRLTDISQLVLLVAAGHRTRAASLATALIPQLMQAGTTPQAWTAMRHVADLLGQVGAPELGLLVLESADDDVGAPAIVGTAVRTHDQLRTRLRTQADSTRPVEPVSLAALWGEVEPVLGAAARSREDS